MSNLFCLAHNCLIRGFNLISISNWFQSDLRFSREFLFCTILIQKFYLVERSFLNFIFLLSWSGFCMCDYYHMKNWSDIFSLISLIWTDFGSKIWCPNFQFPQNFRSKQKISWNLEQAVLLESNDSLPFGNVRKSNITIQRSTKNPLLIHVSIQN